MLQFPTRGPMDPPPALGLGPRTTRDSSNKLSSSRWKLNNQEFHALKDTSKSSLPRLSIATVRAAWNFPTSTVLVLKSVRLCHAQADKKRRLGRDEGERKERKKQGRLFRNSLASVTSRRDRARNFNRPKFNETRIHSLKQTPDRTGTRALSLLLPSPMEGQCRG